MVESVREAGSQVKDLSRQFLDVSNARADIQVERDSFSNELVNAREHIKDLEVRLTIANNSLVQLRAEVEHRVREKDEEIENSR